MYPPHASDADSLLTLLHGTDYLQQLSSLGFKIQRLEKYVRINFFLNSIIISPKAVLLSTKYHKKQERHTRTYIQEEIILDIIKINK